MVSYGVRCSTARVNPRASAERERTRETHSKIVGAGADASFAFNV